MSGKNAIDLMFEGMAKLGPGDDASTLEVLDTLPKREFDVIVDAGCGTGRQTLALAGELKKTIHAIDSYQPFLDDLRQRALGLGMDSFVRTHCLDMSDIPSAFSAIDLLWSEGAAYNIGFGNALEIWASALGEGALAVVSELSWLQPGDAPKHVVDFFSQDYPEMQSVAENIVIAEGRGYRVIGTHELPANGWVDGYYDVLEPRARRLVEHSDSDVVEFARETLKEIDVFESSEGSYGYTFYVLQRR